MLFMVMHKTNAQLEAGAEPDQEIIANMGKLCGEAIEKGMFKIGVGLKRSAERVRLEISGGQYTLTPGPYEGKNELVAGFAMLHVKSMDEAVHWSKRFAEVMGDVEIEIGPVVERWDIGLMPKPADAPLRVLAVHKANVHSESDAAPSPEMTAKMSALIAEMQQAGVMLATARLKSSKHGARLRAKGGKHTWTDGPFTESKELIAGFSIIEIGSLAEAKAWSTRYANVLGDVEVDVREVRQ